MDSYTLAAQYGMLSDDEVTLIKECVSLLSPTPIIINIGASVGTGVCAMLEAQPDAFIFSIDRKPCPDEAKHLRDCNLPHLRVVRVLGDSGVVGVDWPYPADLVFVDGNHSQDAVMQDIRVYKPLVPAGGVMMFHDYNHPNIPDMPALVDREMSDWERIGEARYLVAFRNPGEVAR